MEFEIGCNVLGHFSFHFIIVIIIIIIIIIIITFLFPYFLHFTMCGWSLLQWQNES